jgi:hypothetical protein
MLRERLADNVATAGQEELNGLAWRQNLVVTVPANTRLYVIIEKRTSEPVARAAGEDSASHGRVNRGVPTLEELRQLIELKREINDLYTQEGDPLAARSESQ